MWIVPVFISFIASNVFSMNFQAEQRSDLLNFNFKEFKEIAESMTDLDIAITLVPIGSVLAERRLFEM